MIALKTPQCTYPYQPPFLVTSSSTRRRSSSLGEYSEESYDSNPVVDNSDSDREEKRHHVFSSLRTERSRSRSSSSDSEDVRDAMEEIGRRVMQLVPRVSFGRRRRRMSSSGEEEEGSEEEEEVPCSSSSSSSSPSLCPVCSEEGFELSRSLPKPLHAHSTLVCRLSVSFHLSVSSFFCFSFFLLFFLYMYFFLMHSLGKGHQ